MTKIQPSSGADSLCVDVVGEGRPIVILHGWLLSGRVEQADLEPVFAKASGWRRWYVDLPSSGGSMALTGEPSADHILEIVDGMLGRRLGDEPYAVAGMSAGANLARALAHHHPDSVKGLLMRVPMLIAGDDERQLPRTLGSAGLSPETLAEADEKERVLWEPERARAADPVLMDIRDDPDRYGLRDPTAGGSPYLGPTLLIAGRQDATVGYADAVAALELYPHGTLAVLDQADHRLPTSAQRAVFESLVSEWLARVARAW